jgi:hypothetical protein
LPLRASAIKVFSACSTSVFGIGAQSGEGGQVDPGKDWKSPDRQPYGTVGGSSNSLKVKNVWMP